MPPGNEKSNIKRKTSEVASRQEESLPVPEVAVSEGQLPAGTRAQPLAPVFSNQTVIEAGAPADFRATQGADEVFSTLLKPSKINGSIWTVKRYELL